MNRKLLVLLAVAGLIAPALAACGGSSGGSGDSGQAIVVGTSDQIRATKDNPAPLDPAASYDIGEWNVLANVFQTLVSYPRAGTQPIPDAASRCGFVGSANKVYSCDLRTGLEFSNGDPLTAADVKYSIDRQIGIKNSNGPSSLLLNVARVDTSGKLRVVFHLKTPDATFPFKLATPAAAIVDSKVYPRHSIYRGYRVMGSGPYQLTSWKPDHEAVFTANPNYQGVYRLENSKIELRFFADSADMVRALKSHKVDVINRTMTPAEILTFQDDTSSNINLVQAPGSEIRYLVFNMTDPTMRKLAVRKAMAQVVDREALVRDVYKRTSQPLYSMVPQGIVGHDNAFFNLYGGDPNVSAARTTLRNAGISTPIHLTLAYTTDHYGESSGAEVAELAKQLDGSGLFKVTPKGVPWAQFETNAFKGDYPLYEMGWFPDFPDADNYLSPFFGKDNFLGNSYDNATISNQVIPKEQDTADRGAANDELVQAQKIIAQQVPFLPLWQGNQYLAADSRITGTEWALNASSQLQFWELGRGVKGS